MKLEVRCPGCGRGYRIDEAKVPAAGGRSTCRACGAAIEIPARAAPRTQQPPPSPPPPKEEPPSMPPRGREASGGVGPAAGQVVCPRCGLHFSPAGAAHAGREASRPTVLVVEDKEYFLEIAKDALCAKYEVRTATTLAEARRELAAGRIDAIVLDLTLAGGEEGLTLVREMPFKPCPVVAFTAEDETELYGESWARLRAAGIDDLVVKGINAGEALLRKIGALLGEAEPEAETGR